MMRIIVTGGTGLIGQALSRSLVSDGHEVHVLSRNPAKAKHVAAGVHLVQWDAQSALGWGELADGADAIVNLAGEGIADGRWSKERRERILQSRRDAGAAVMQAISAATEKPKALVQASAVGYYGPRGDELISESTSPGSDWLSHVVFEWENTTAAAARMGVRRTVARTGLVFSRQGGAFPKMKLPFDMVLAGGPLGSGKQYVPWIHLEDEVRALRFLIEDPAAEGAYNLSAPNPVNYKEFASTMGEVMGRPSFMPVPGFALKAVLGAMASILLTGQRVVPQRLTEQGFTFNFPELAPALRNLLNKEPAPA